jgi:hypothetical protein
MAVMRCPECGDLYLEAPDRCQSCGADLVGVAERPSPPRRSVPSSARTVGTAEHESWELNAWTMEGRRLLDGMLTSAHIPHSWQGSTLLAPEVEHDQVAGLVDEVAEGDARVGLDDADEGKVDAPAGNEADGYADDESGAGEIGYDLSEWSDDMRGDLIAALAAAGIEHGWDADGDLVVDAADEDRTDAVFAQLTGDAAVDGDDGDVLDALVDADLDDEPDDGIDDGLLVQETLSELFIGADRLMHNPLDGTASRQVIEGRETARTLRLPFGFERIQWQGILLASDELVERISPPAGEDGSVPTPDDDAIREAAADLRHRLREVV